MDTTTTPRRPIWPALLLLGAGIVVGYVIPRPSARARALPDLDVVELGRQLQTADQVGRYQFFVMGETRVPLRGDTATGEVTVALPTGEKKAAAFLDGR